MTQRQRLTDRRTCETFEFEVGGQHYTATIGRFADGMIGEIFLQNHKPGSQSDSNARDAAVAAKPSAAIRLPGRNPAARAAPR
jgi:hypothetical protein